MKVQGGGGSGGMASGLNLLYDHSTSGWPFGLPEVEWVGGWVGEVGEVGEWVSA